MDKYTASAGAISSSTAAMTTDLELNKIVLVGVIGAIIYALKTVSVSDLKDAPIATLFKMPWMVASPAALTVVVYYIGTDGFNILVKDVGEPIWTFTGLLFGLFNDKIFPFIGSVGMGIKNMKLRSDDDS